MERRWKRNVVALVSSVTVVIRLPISCMSSMAISCHVYQLSLWQMGRRCLCWPIWSICLSCSVLFNYYYYYYFLTPFPGNEKKLRYAIQKVLLSTLSFTTKSNCENDSKISSFLTNLQAKVKLAPFYGSRYICVPYRISVKYMLLEFQHV